MPEAAVLGFGAGALAFLAVAAVLLVGWRGGLAGALLLAAVGVSVLWAAALGLFQWYGLLPAPVLGLADGLRYAAWFAFLGVLVWRVTGDQGPVRVLLAGAAVLAVAELGFAATRLVGLGAGWMDGVPVYAGIAASLLGLVLVEQLFRNASEAGRWALKYLCLGVGGLFAYDLFLFADTLLLQRLDSGAWAARGAVNALVAPLIAVSAARNPDWSLDVYVSRRFVLHTAAFTGTGIYLVLMAAVGYSIRVYGGVWAEPLQILFLAGAVMVLLVLVSSGRFRAQARVFLSKHFFNYRYDYREEWLRFARTLAEGEGAAPLKERVVHAVAQVLDSPAGQLWQRRDNGFVPTAQWNLAEPGQEIGRASCRERVYCEV